MSGTARSSGRDDDRVEPRARPLRGDARRARDRERGAAGEPARRPARAAALGLHAAGLRGGPTVYVLQGFTGQLEMWRNRVAFRPTFLELLDREDIDARVVFVDAFTSVGGSQFVDSHGSGRYHTYICDEIVPFVDARYDSNGFRGVAGKSSGGYGAAITAMLRPDLFSGLREPRRRRPVRGLDPAVLPARRPAAARRVRRIDRALPRRAPHRPGAARPPARPAHPAPVGLLGGLLGRPGRHDPASLRHDDGAGDPGAVGALARVGLPDARAAPRRRAARAARRSTSTSAPATSGSST